MTDGLSELVRVGLRNPVRIVVKVEAKRKAKVNAGSKRKAGEDGVEEEEKYDMNERRTPARFVRFGLS